MLKVSTGYFDNAKVKKVYDLNSFTEKCESEDLVNFMEVLKTSKKGIGISVRKDNEHTRVYVSIRNKYFVIDLLLDKFKNASIVNKSDYNRKADAIVALEQLIKEHNEYIEDNKNRILENAIPGESYGFTVYDIGLFEGKIESVDAENITFKNTKLIVSTHENTTEKLGYEKYKKITFKAEDIAYLKKNSIPYAV